MTALSVRVSEDPARPLGHAIITLGGLPRELETFEFALSRHGFANNHLGMEGWQGAECWLQPEEAWFSGELLKFVIHPDLVFQLENMPYRLTVRGQGLAGTASTTFVWPLQLELEEGTDLSQRKVVGGTRVNLAPAPRPEPATAQPPPLPEVNTVDLAIPDVPIPKIATHEEIEDDDQTQEAPPLLGNRQRLDGPDSAPLVSEVLEPTAPARGAPVIPPAPTDIGTIDQRPPLTEARVPLADQEPAVPVILDRPPPRPITAPHVEQAAASRPGKSGMLIGFLGLGMLLLALAAVGWWWLSQPPEGKRAATSPAQATIPGGTIPQAAPPAFQKAEPAPESPPAVRPMPEPESPVNAPPVDSTLEPVDQPAALEPSPPATPPPVTTQPASPSSSAGSAPTGTTRSLEDELKLQFDPTQQELEKRLRSEKPSP